MFDGSEYIYLSMYVLGFAIMMVINLKTYKKFEINKNVAIIATLITYVAGVVGAMMMGKLYTVVSELFKCYDNSTVAIFGAIVFTPLILVLIFKALKWNDKALLDMLTPGIFTVLLCAKFGCFFAGCCTGIMCDFGIYNPIVGRKTFPIQLVEVAVMIIIVVETQYFFNRYKKYKSGMSFPITAAVYSITRFIFEEFRFYSSEKMRNLFMGMSFWQVCCIVVLVCSAISVYMLSKQKRKHHIKTYKNQLTF